MCASIDYDSWEGYQALLQNPSPHAWRMSRLPNSLPMAAKIELTEAFNEGLSAPQPTIPEGASPAGHVLIWAAFQAGTRWKFDEHVTVDVFMGDPEKFYIFEAQISELLERAPRTYNTEQKKMIAVFTHLGDLALDWAFNYLDKDRFFVRFDTCAELMTTMSQAFSNPGWEKVAASQIFELTQTRSCASYYAEFSALANRLGWTNTDYMIPLFEHGLKPHMKRKIAINRRAAPQGSLKEFANYCTMLESRKY